MSRATAKPAETKAFVAEDQGGLCCRPLSAHLAIRRSGIAERTLPSPLLDAVCRSSDTEGDCSRRTRVMQQIGDGKNQTSRAPSARVARRRPIDESLRLHDLSRHT